MEENIAAVGFVHHNAYTHGQILRIQQFSNLDTDHCLVKEFFSCNKITPTGNPSGIIPSSPESHDI